MATRVFHEFRAYQRTQPILNLAAFLPLPRWFPRLHRRATRQSAKTIRGLIAGLTRARRRRDRGRNRARRSGHQDHDHRRPGDRRRLRLGGDGRSGGDLLPCGHETSASALAWTLYLLALDPAVQEAVAQEAADLGEAPDFAAIGRLKLARDVFREALRLYPPVPMMVRENRCPEEFRGRKVAPGAQVVLSPWHQHRHERLWENPDAFDPARWQTEEGRASARVAYMPFSAGPRVCTGAGFAMVEGPLLLALLVRPSASTPCPERCRCRSRI